MKLLALIALLLIGATSQAATIEIGTPSYIRPVGDQLYYFPADERAPPRVAWPGMENNDRDISAPTSKGRVPVTINQKAPVAINKLGKAATNLAQRVGPVALGLGVAGLICDLTDICSSPSDPENPASAPIFSKPDPSDKPFTYQRWRTAVPGTYVPVKEFETASEACDYIVPLFIAEQTKPGAAFTQAEFQQCFFALPTLYNATFKMKSVTGVYSDWTINAATQIQNCPSTHYLDGNMCRPSNPLPRIPVTPGDWDTAGDEPGLNDPGIIPDLIEGGEPIPVDTPSIDPKTVPSPSGSTTETVRNGQGEPIGTKTTDTTVTVSPSGPTTVNVTETTTITETNITNNTTTTTTQETTLPNNEDQSEKPKEDQDIEIDNVDDQDLDTHEIPDTFTYDSWGGGSCPGNPTIPALGRSYSLPVDKVCDAMVNFRPVVLLIAALVSAYIISGAFRQ